MKIKEGLEMRYRPFDNYISMQNPPDFSRGLTRQGLQDMT